MRFKSKKYSPGGGDRSISVFLELFLSLDSCLDVLNRPDSAMGTIGVDCKSSLSCIKPFSK
jgi:hypothetical protein